MEIGQRLNHVVSATMVDNSTLICNTDAPLGRNTNAKTPCGHTLAHVMSVFLTEMFTPMIQSDAQIMKNSIASQVFGSPWRRHVVMNVSVLNQLLQRQSCSVQMVFTTEEEGYIVVLWIMNTKSVLQNNSFAL
jgi:hypothetical protein